MSQPSGKRPFANFNLPKPGSPISHLHIVLSQIEEDLPNFALHDGKFIGSFLLNHKLSDRYPGLTNNQRKRVVDEISKNSKKANGSRAVNEVVSLSAKSNTKTNAKSTANAKMNIGSNGKASVSTDANKAAVAGLKLNSEGLINQRPSGDLASIAAAKFASNAYAQYSTLISETDSSFPDSSSYYENARYATNTPPFTSSNNKISDLNFFLKENKPARLGSTSDGKGDKNILDLQLGLLNIGDKADGGSESTAHDIKNAVVFSSNVLEHSSHNLPQYGLLGHAATRSSTNLADARLYLNTNIPFSAFICGVQGSGKSHTTACMIENCIIQSPMLGSLQKPLSALVFNFSEYSSTANFRPSEVAFLASPNKQNPTHLRASKVNVLVSPSNYLSLAGLYSQIPGVEVEPFKIHTQDLTINTMLTLMSVDNSHSPPLYMGTVTKILRQMAAESAGGFAYTKFRRLLDKAGLDKKQLEFLEQRLDLLESFLDLEGETSKPTFKAGEITVIDLSCPFLDASTACVLFKIGMGIYLDSDTNVGKLIVLDEAHKYMTGTPASKALTDSLLSIIRQQRHYGARVLVSTQEPTISPHLIDLCAMTVIHRFTSPEWMNVLKKHVSIPEDTDKDNGAGGDLFNKILRLKTGEALVFAPSAVVGLPTYREEMSEGGDQDRTTSANELIRIRIRKRVTWDGGASVVCV